MARDYWFQFGSGNPTTAAGLSPTFIFFVNSSGQTLAPPAVAETYSGSGMYKVNYNATQTIAFVLDGATTGLASPSRYISGVFDPQDQFGPTLIAVQASLAAMSVTLSALGSFVGTTSSSIGSTLIDPTTVMGFLMRSMQFQEGNYFYTKSTGVLDIYTIGNSTLLRSKTVADTTSQTSKT